MSHIIYKGTTFVSSKVCKFYWCSYPQNIVMANVEKQTKSLTYYLYNTIKRKLVQVVTHWLATNGVNSH